MNKPFGEYIREVRKSNGLTLTQMAAKLQMDSANLSKIENSKREFDEKKLELFAELFEKDLDELKTEYYSEQIAKKIYRSGCSETVLSVAEQKVKYFKQSDSEQGSLDL